MDDEGAVHFGREPWDPEVATVAAMYVVPDFSRHAHSRCVVGLAVRGGRRMELSGMRFLVPQGGVFVIPAHTPHSCAPLGPPPHAHQAVCLPKDSVWELAREGGGGGDGPQAAAYRLGRFFDLVADGAPACDRRAALAAAMAAVTAWCWPHGDGFGPGAAAQRPEVERAADFLAQLAVRNPSLEEAARHAGISPFHLHRLFAARFGLAPHAYVQRERLRLALAALMAGESLASAAALAGYADQSHFTRCFRRAVGVTPGRFVRTLKRPAPRLSARPVPSG